AGNEQAAGHRRFVLSDGARQVMALLIAAIFATNWHVLGCALLIMSEPAFMLVVVAWLLLAMRWGGWEAHLDRTLVLALLAVAAWSIRGAGIVCVATMAAYPLGKWVADVLSRSQKVLMHRRILPVVMVVVLAAGYQVTLSLQSPEKSLAAGQSS